MSSRNEKISFDAQRIAELLVHNASLRSEHTEEMEKNLVIGTFAPTFDISDTTSPEAVTPIIEESPFTQKLVDHSIIDV